MANILVIGSNSTGPLLIDRAQSCGHQVIFLERHGPRAYASTAEFETIVEQCAFRGEYSTDDSESYEGLRGLVSVVSAQWPIDAVVCGDGPCVEHAADVAEYLGLPFSPRNSIRLAHDKLLFRQVLENSNLLNPRFSACSSLPDAMHKAQSQIGFPLILKPRTGHSSSCCFLARDVAELRDSWFAFDEFMAGTDEASRVELGRGRMIEEYISGDMYSVEVASNGRVIEPLVVASRVRSRQNEFSDYRIDMPANLTPVMERSCKEYACAVVSALGLGVGIFHVEIMLNSTHSPVCIECNPRLMGGYMPLLFSNVFDANVYDLLVGLHLDRRCEIPSFQQKLPCAATVRIEAAKDGIAANSREFRIPKLEDADILFDQFDNSLRQGDLIQSGQVLGRFQVSCQNHVKLSETVEKIISDLEIFHGIELLK